MLSTHHMETAIQSTVAGKKPNIILKKQMLTTDRSASSRLFNPDRFATQERVLCRTCYDTEAALLSTARRTYPNCQQYVGNTERLVVDDSNAGWASAAPTGGALHFRCERCRCVAALNRGCLGQSYSKGCMDLDPDHVGRLQFLVGYRARRTDWCI